LCTLEQRHAAAVSHASDRCPHMIRILIDPVACDAYGYCAELLPEAISLDEWGYPIVDGKPLPPELVDVARRAARDCPRRAITLRERKGGS
jgi:ferredoxin